MDTPTEHARRIDKQELRALVETDKTDRDIPASESDNHNIAKPAHKLRKADKPAHFGTHEREMELHLLPLTQEWDFQARHVVYVCDSAHPG
jgi:hypothetical protein